MDNAQFMDLYNRMVARCWVDEEFKAKIMENPSEILKSEGIELPEGIEFKIVENTSAVQYLVLPIKPKDIGELDDEQLDKVAGGQNVPNFNSIPSVCCVCCGVTV